MTERLAFEGEGVAEIISELKTMQTLLGTPDIGEVLSFCINVASNVVQQAQHGLQLGFYNPSTDEIVLYESSYLTTLLELSRELTPEDPSPD